MNKLAKQKEKKAEWMRDYRMAHPEKREAAAAAQRAYYAANREKRMAYARAWAKAHPEKVRDRARKRLRESPVENAIRSTRHSAKVRGLTYSLPKLLAYDLISDACFYCGVPPLPKNGIDRVDNSIGYEESNVVTACKNCNRAKSTLTQAEFEQWGVRLGKNLSKYQVDEGVK